MDEGVKSRDRGDGGAGFDLDMHAGQKRQHPGEGGALQQGLAAGDDKAVTPQR